MQIMENYASNLSRRTHITFRHASSSSLYFDNSLLPHNNGHPCQSISHVEKDTVYPANNAPYIKWINLMGTLGIG